MSDICRLCLSLSTQTMWPISDCVGILNNSISFSMHIPVNNVLPDHVCTICFNKLTDFNNFCLQVQNNEKILIKEQEKGPDALNNFYEEIRNKIKRETMDNIEQRDIVLKEVKTENDSNSECELAFDSEDDLPLLNTNNLYSKEIQEKKINNTHDKMSNGVNSNNVSNFKCLTCFEIFVNQNYLLNHYNDTHKMKEKIKGNNFTQVKTDEKNLYKCNDCDKTYDNVRAVNKHLKTHCTENFHCKICGRTYKTVSEIIRHGRAHDGTKISCSFGCGFATVYSGALKSHEQRHKDDFKFKCDTCGKSFQVKTWYEQHQNIHTGAKPYVCDICGMAFHMDRYLKAHCSAVHPESSSKKRYVCVKCSQPCATMKALTRHLKEHGITSSSLCDLCGKTLCSTEQLRIHRRIHTGVKPYSCNTCSKSFAKRSNLKLHQITHSGERAHACTTCGKHYSQRSTLLRHVHRHHAENTKKCSKCDTTFTNQAELRAHQKICSYSTATPIICYTGRPTNKATSTFPFTNSLRVSC